MSEVLKVLANGANGSTLVDASASGHTFSYSGGAAVASQYLLLDGTGDYVTSTTSPSDFAFAGDFTIEFRAKKSANGSAGFDIVMSTYTVSNASDGWWIELSSSRGLFFGGANSGYSGSTAYVSYNFNPNDSTDHHYAICKSGTSLKLFKDGVTVATATHSFALVAAILYIGHDFYNEDFNGRLRDLRITPSALYTADFTPPPVNFDSSVTAVATGFTSTAFGTPRVLNQIEQASGFTTTHFGTPAGSTSVKEATGFSTTMFGTPAALVYVAEGFLATVFGSPSSRVSFRASHMGPVTRFGTPSTPTNRTQDASGFMASIFGTPGAVEFDPVSGDRLTAARWLDARARFGLASVHATFTAHASSLGPTAQFGTPGSTESNRTQATGHAPATAFGAPSVRLAQRAAGSRSTQFGTGKAKMTLQAQSVGLAQHWGQPRQWGPHMTTGREHTRMGHPTALQRFNHPATGFHPTTFGTPSAFEHHLAHAMAPTSHFGTPTVRRDTQC